MRRYSLFLILVLVFTCRISAAAVDEVIVSSSIVVEKEPEAASPEPAVTAEAEQGSSETAELDHDALLKKYEELKLDRENLLAQTRKLLARKRESENMVAGLEDIKKEQEELRAANIELKEKTAKLEKSGQSAVLRISELEQEKVKLEALADQSGAKETLRKMEEENKAELLALKKEMEEQVKTMAREKAEALAAIKKYQEKATVFEKESAKLKELENKYNNEAIARRESERKAKEDFLTMKKGFTSDMEKLKKEMAALNKEKQKEREIMAKKNEKLAKDIDKIKDEKEDAQRREKKDEAKIGDLQKKLKTEKTESKTARKEEQITKHKAERLPVKIKNIAQHNESLSKQVNNMHYNNGVFYCKQKDYKRAAIEFREALKVNPNDRDAIFNLGLIYAEYRIDRIKAVEYFEKYLRLDNKSTNAEWAKQYIMKWEMWRRTSEDVLK